MKKQLFKTMLAAVLLMIGTVSARAEEVTASFNAMDYPVSNSSGNSAGGIKNAAGEVLKMG